MADLSIIRDFCERYPFALQRDERGEDGLNPRVSEGRGEHLPGVICLDMGETRNVEEVWAQISPALAPLLEAIAPVRFEPDLVGDSPESQFFALSFNADPDADPDAFASVGFELAHMLMDEANVPFAQPDLELEYDDPELALRGGGSAGDDDNINWAHGEINLQAALNLLEARGIDTPGSQTWIGHPDTGYAGHREVNPSGVQYEKGSNTIVGGLPDDPLWGLNPGHGDATASVFGSPSDPAVQGIAPHVNYIPYRASRSVVLFPRMRPLAKAIKRAIEQQVDIISMSLGGLSVFTEARAMIRRAYEADILMVAAAANGIPRSVTYPASDPHVVGLTGSSPDQMPWRQSSRGRAADISAPAKSIATAAWERGNPVINPTANGTSFATAITAGAGALWLEYYGREYLVGVAEHKGGYLQDLFRAALIASAQDFADDSHLNQFGAGILDIEGLLKTDPAALKIDPVRPRGETRSGRDQLLEMEQDYLEVAQQVRGGSRVSASPTYQAQR